MQFFNDDSMKKFLAILLLLFLALSACAQKPMNGGALGETGTLCGTLMAAKREGIYIRAENNNTYLFGPTVGLDLSDADIGDKLYVKYSAEVGPLSVTCALKVNMECGTLLSLQSDGFTIQRTDDTTMTFGYAESIDMDGFETGDCLYVEYVKKRYADDEEHVWECPEATTVLKVGN